MELESLKEGFMLEAVELLDEAEDALLAMDDPTKLCNFSYNQIFRVFPLV